MQERETKTGGRKRRGEDGKEEDKVGWKKQGSISNTSFL